MTAAAVAARRKGRKPTPAGRLTAREAQIVTLLAQGVPQAKAAESLGITYGTVHNHIAKARHRTGAVTLTHLLALSIAAGDVDPDCADGTGVFT